MVASERGWTKFVHPTLGFSLHHPSDWEVFPNAMACAVVMLEPTDEPVLFRPNLNVTIHPAPSLAEFVKEEQERAGRILTNFKVTDHGELEVDGVPSTRTTASYRQGETDIVTVQWHMDPGGAIVTVSAAAEVEDYRRLDETFERIATSFRTWDAKANG